jgi:phosphate transport system substrate-binding protein
LYLDKSPTRALRPIVQEFLSFLNSRDGQEVVVKTGFYPLPVAQIERNVAALGPLVR